MQRLQRALERRSLEHLGAALELFAKLLLLAREVGERAARVFGGELVGRVHEVGELLLQLRGERVLKQALHVAQLLRERRIEHAGRA